MTTHIDNRHLKFRTLYIPRGQTAVVLRIEKSPNLGNGLTDCREIWHGEAQRWIWYIFAWGRK